MQERLLPKARAAKYIGCSAPVFDRLVTAGDIPLPVPTCYGPRWDRHDLDAYVDGLKGPKRGDWRSRSKLYAAEAH